MFWGQMALRDHATSPLYVVQRRVGIKSGLVVRALLRQKRAKRMALGPVVGGSLSVKRSTRNREIHAMSGDYNMSMRKFLKQVGVTSQQAIEDGLRTAGTPKGKSFEAKVVLTIDGLEVEHVVTGQIKDDNS